MGEYGGSGGGVSYLSPTLYLGEFNGSNPSTTSAGQWFIRTDLGTIMMYTGSVLVNVALNTQVITASLSLAAGTYSDIIIPSGVTVSLAASASYTFKNVFNYGTISSAGCTQVYTGEYGLVNIGGTYTTTGSDTISGILSSSTFGANIAIPSGATLTMGNIIMNGQISGAGTLAIPANSILIYNSSTAMNWTPAALTLDGELYLTSATTGTPNKLTTAVTAGAYGVIRCETSLSVGDSNFPATASYASPPLELVAEYSDLQYWFFSSYRLYGKGFIAVSGLNTPPTGAGSQLNSGVNMADAAAVSTEVVGTGHNAGWNLTSITAQAIGQYTLSYLNYTTGYRYVFAVLWVGSLSSTTLDVYMFDHTNVTSTADDYYFCGTSGVNGIYLNIASFPAVVAESTNAIVLPSNFTVTATFYY